MKKTIAKPKLMGYSNPPPQPPLPRRGGSPIVPHKLGFCYIFSKSNFIPSFCGGFLVVSSLLIYPSTNYPAQAASLGLGNEPTIGVESDTCKYCFNGEVQWSKGDYAGKTSELDATFTVKECNKADLDLTLTTDGTKETTKITDIDIKIKDDKITIPLNFDEKDLKLNLKLDPKTGEFSGDLKWKLINVTESIEGTYTKKNIAGVPEPFTISGTLMALGFGVAFKRKLSKIEQKDK